MAEIKFFIVYLTFSLHVCVCVCVCFVFCLFVYLKCYAKLLAMAEEKHGVVSQLIGHLCLHARRHGAGDIIKLVPGIVQSLIFGPTRSKTYR